MLRNRVGAEEIESKWTVRNTLRKAFVHEQNSERRTGERPVCHRFVVVTDLLSVPDLLW